MNTDKRLPILLFFIIALGYIGWNIPESASAQSGNTPILVVVNDSASNKFGRYLGEILRAEGLNSFNIITLGSLTAPTIADYPVTLLAETPLSASQATIFTNYVNNGGNLIAMRPDAQITGLLGLGSAAGTQNNGYMDMTGSGPSQGLSTQTLQIHGTADRYNLAGGATMIAQLYATASTSTPYPAVARSANGRGVAFTYDLARTVVYMRQGNPANANVDTDGDGILRTIDLFQANGGGSPWVNLNRTQIPQADEQQRLLARLIKDMIEPVMPLPQLWYFPGAAKTMLIPTGDAHGNPVTWHQNLINAMNDYAGDITLYITFGGDITNDDVQVWRSQGHEFGIHPYAYREDSYEPYNIDNLEEGYDVYTSWYSMTYSSPMSRTVRNHQVAWEGWTDAAEYAVSKGIAMDTNFYSWGAWLQKPDSSWARGYITGSGQPMKFIKTDGTILPYYQQLTTLIDEQFVDQAGAGSIYEALNPADAVAVSRQIIDTSLAGDYAALMTQFHVDYFGIADEWVAGTLAYAQSKGIPIWNADRWLNFTETRHDANFSNINWNNTTNTLSFNLNSSATPGIQITTMLPLNHNGSGLQSVTVNGTPASFSIQIIKGQSVAFITTNAGNRTITAVYTASPITTTPTHTPTHTPTYTPTYTPSNTPSSTPSDTPTPTYTLTPSNTPTNTPTGTLPAVTPCYVDDTAFHFLPGNSNLPVSNQTDTLNLYQENPCL